jgi:cell division protein FtsX
VAPVVRESNPQHDADRENRNDPAALTSDIRDKIRRRDSSLPIAAVRTMDEVVDRAIATPKLTGTLLATIAAMGLGLAALGIFGVLSYVVSLRRQEIGVRLAIGATPRHVLASVMRQGLGYAAIGAAVGLAGAAAMSRVLAGLLHDVTPLDPVTFVATPILLMLVAVLASAIPVGAQRGWIRSRRCSRNRRHGPCAGYTAWPRIRRMPLPTLCDIQNSLPAVTPAPSS